jgi:hypothetical protein
VSKFHIFGLGILDPVMSNIFNKTDFFMLAPTPVVLKVVLSRENDV